MKNNIFKFFLLGLVAITVFACSKDFLNAPAQGAFDGNTLANEVGVDASLVSAYSMLDGWNDDWGTFNPPWGGAGSNWIWGSVVSDEAYKGSEPNDQLEAQLVESFIWTPGNGYFNVKFQALYEGVSRSNATMTLLQNVEGISDAAVKEGEARFLRGHYHFEAWKFWKNVPYYTEADDNFQKPNDRDIVPDIIADFQFAADNLPTTQPEVGRATKGAAQAYLGKVLLYNGDFQGAKAEFDKVVNSQVYALQPCFHDIFTTGGENGSGMLFSIQASTNDGTTEGQNGNFADRLNRPNGGGTFSCCGFHQPSQNLVNSHKVDADGLPLVSTFNDADVAPTDAVDPRLDWTVGRDDVPFLQYGFHGPDWIRARAWAGPFSPKKFIYAPGENQGNSWNPEQLSSLNIPIIRYADVLLMLAECEVDAPNGSLERARELVNMVRMRAGGCTQDTLGNIIPIDSPEVTWATYSVGTYDEVWTDKNAARDAVRFERKIELALEGHRFFDLRRWGNAVQHMNDYLAVESTKREYLQGAVMEEKHMLYPLPSFQIELSKVDGTPQLKQNPGF